jgi:PPP family 3-phenylpropionic acid transporter
VSGESPETSVFASRAARVTLVMSAMFGTAGVILVFLPRWFEVERHLGGAEIGAILSLAQFARILTGPVIAHWADGAADRRTPLRLVSLAAVIAYAAFFTFAHDFISLLVLGFAALSLTQTMTPLLEAALLRATAQGRISYGFGRGAGSVVFIIANVAGGALIARFGLGAVVVWVLAGLIATTGSAWLALKPDPPLKRSPHAHIGAGVGALLKSRRFVILLIACGLIQSAHAFYYSFSVLVWRGQGLSPDLIGWLWAFGGIVEVAFLWNLPSVERRVTPEALILMGAGGGALRWLCMGFGPTGLVLWPLQALHVTSFACAHVGAMRLLFREAPEASQAMAQTLYAATSAGILMGASTLLSGFLYDRVGAGGYWAMSAMAFAGGALAILLIAPRSRAPGATSR